MSAAELMATIRDADRHRGGLRCRRLLRVEAAFFATLRDEVERLCSIQLPSDVMRRDHITNWTQPFGEVHQFSLLNGTGRYDDFSKDHDLSCFGKQFHAGSDYVALGRLIAAFPHTVNFRINVLGPLAGLSPHEEHALIRTVAGTISVRVRFHLPVVTNPRAELMLDGDVHHLEQGTIYFVNNGCVHSANNHGDTPRIHLTWDMLLTQDTYDCMFGERVPNAPLVRVPEVERDLKPIRNDPVGTYSRIHPLVSAREAERLQLCGEQ